MVERSSKIFKVIHVILLLRILLLSHLWSSHSCLPNKVQFFRMALMPWLSFDLTVLFSGISQFYFNMSCAFSCLSSSFWMECSCSSFWMECLSSFYLLLEILVPRASLRASEFKMSKTFSWIHSLPRNGFPYFKTIYLSVVFLLCKCHLVLWLLRVLIIRW